MLARGCRGPVRWVVDCFGGVGMMMRLIIAAFRRFRLRQALHPEAILMFMSAVAAVLVAYIESRRREPTQHSYERYDSLMESMIDMRERMARMEQRYKLYPPAESLVDFEYQTKARLDKLEDKD